MTELIVPIARRLVMNAPAVPLSMQGQVSGYVRNLSEAKEIGHAFGRSSKPKAPIMLVGPDDRTIILIIGDGTAEAAELEDIAVMKMEQRKKTDFALLREQAGEMPREKVDSAIRQAFADHHTRQQRNQRTGGR